MPEKLARMAKSIVAVETDDIAKHPSVKPRDLTVVLSEVWFALHVGIWLFLLPIFLRFRPLPELLKHFTQVRSQPKSRGPLEMDRAVRIVTRVCQMRVFRLPIFLRPCLRQALALYRTLTRMGYPVEIHFGIHKQGEDLQGHAWVTIQGKPVADTARSESFKPVYSYRSGLCRSLDEVSKITRK
jgi:hypothetical protein